MKNSTDDGDEGAEARQGEHEVVDEFAPAVRSDSCA